MSNFIKTQKEIKNKNGKIIERVMNITPKKGSINIKEVNKLYKALINKIDSEKMMIKVISIDGYKTIKSYDFNEDDLTYAFEDYYSSLPKDTRTKFNELLGIQVITKNY